MRHIILGTAGHIDHGKSSLVKALTGIDPDRLKEEKERGITIDLGFADIVYPDGLTVGIVDVPGHERLIKNMLAGAGGIDLVMLVIAADEGIMPQSKEHLQICNLLKIKSGLIAVTKADLVEQDWLELVKEDVKEFVRGTFLEGAEIIPVSSKSMFNIELLKERIKDIALKVEPKPIKGLFRLPIDRVFTLKGFGTVVTGTAILGSISVDNDIEILPSNIKSKVRGLHSHGKSIHSAYAGQRVAINLQSVDKDSIQRGDVVVIPGKLMPTGKIDAKIELLSDAPVLKTRSLVHFHLGTSETTARVILFGQSELKPGENCYGQFRLSSPVVAMSGDRYIIRRFSPLETIGGGEVLDPLSFRRSFRESVEDLRIFEIGSLSDKIAAKIKRAGAFGIKTSIIEGWIKEEIPSIKEAIKYLKEKNTVLQFEDILIHRTIFDSFKNNAIQQLSEFHKANPLKPGMSKEELRIKLNIEPRLFGNLISTLNEIVIEKEFVRLNSFKVALSDKDESTQLKIIQLLEKSEFQPPSKDEISQTLKIDPKKLQDILKLMSNEGKLIRISDTIYITSDVYEKIIKKMKDFFSKKPEMTVAEFRDILNTTRKYALPFLEYLDSHNVTLRVGDIRKLLSR